MRQIEFQTDSYVNPLLKVLAYLRSFKRTPKDEKKRTKCFTFVTSSERQLLTHQLKIDLVL